MSKLAELSIALLSFYSLSFFFSLSPHKGCIREAAKRHFLRGEGEGGKGLLNLKKYPEIYLGPISSRGGGLRP